MVPADSYLLFISQLGPEAVSSNLFSSALATIEPSYVTGVCIHGQRLMGVLCGTEGSMWTLGKDGVSLSLFPACLSVHSKLQRALYFGQPSIFRLSSLQITGLLHSLPLSACTLTQDDLWWS